MWRALFGLLLVLLLGCGKSHSPAQSLKPADVPSPVLKAAKERLPEVSFHKAWRSPGGSYGLRGKSKQGKLRTIQVSPEGKVIEVE
jgi:hypothetical protein